MKRIISLILTACLMLTITGCGTKAPELAKNGIVKNIFYTVKKGNISSVKVNEGSVIPSLYHAYFETFGEVDEIYHRLGDEVKSGDVIYSMNSEIKEENDKLEEKLEHFSEISSYYVKEHENQIIRMRERLNTLTGYDREMYETEISETELNNKLFDDNRIHEEKELRNSLEEKRAREAKSVVKAPADGIIVYMAAHENGKVTEGNLAVVIADKSKKYFCIEYREESGFDDIEKSRLLIGGKTIEEPEPLFYTEEELQNAEDYDLKLFTRYDFSGKDIPVGTYGCLIEEKDIRENVLYVPNECIFEDEESGKSFVYLKSPEKEKNMAFVETGTVCDYFTEISSGLNEGDQVYISDEEFNTSVRYDETTVKKSSFSQDKTYSDISKYFYDSVDFFTGVPGKIEEVYLDSTSDVYVKADTKIISVMPSVSEKDYEKARIDYETAKLDYEKQVKSYNERIEQKEKDIQNSADRITTALLSYELEELKEELVNYEKDNSENVEELKKKQDNYEIWKNGEPVIVYAGSDGIFNATNTFVSGASYKPQESIATISVPGKYYIKIKDVRTDVVTNIRYGTTLNLGSETNDGPVSISADAFSCADVFRYYSDTVYAVPENENGTMITDNKTTAQYESINIDNVLVVEQGFIFKDDSEVNYVMLRLDDEGNVARRNVTVVKTGNNMAWIASGLSEGDILCRKRS